MARRAANRRRPVGFAVPLVADQALLGALWLGFPGRRTFAAADQRLVRAYADLAAGAIVRFRLGAVRQLLLAANEAERARLESVLRQMPIGVILAAVPDGAFLYANEAARRLSPVPSSSATRRRTRVRAAFGPTARRSLKTSGRCAERWPARPSRTRSSRSSTPTSPVGRTA